MLKELLQMKFGCPVCGRILYPIKVRGYWCPYCGTDLKYNTENDKQISINLTNRLVLRDENGIPYYNGEHTLLKKTYTEDMSFTAISEVLEKLCQFEEIDEKNDEIIDELINQENISE